MKKNKRKLSKYGLGTTQNIPNPSEIIAESHLNADKAVAEAKTNPAVVALQTAGNLAMQYGTANGGMGTVKGLEKFGGVLDGIMTTTGMASFAKGGKASGKIEVEGEEVVQTPNGKAVKVKGPKHEDGGVKLDVPPGTDVYSDRLEVGGESMADRKLKRDRRVKRLMKKLDTKDKILTDSTKRELSELEMEDRRDMALQGIARSLDQLNTVGENYDENQFKLGTGDALAMAGTLYSTLSPMLSTMNQRKNDTLNPNYFEDFGKEGIRTLENQQEYIEGQKAITEKRIDQARVDTAERNRQMSRGVNQMRAGDLAAQSSSNKALEDTYAKYSQMMMSNLGAISQAQMTRDNVVMQGEAQADMANRADTDAYYTAMSTAQSNIGTGIQQMGKNLNQSNVNKANLAATNAMLKQYGVRIKENGEVVKLEDKDK